MKEDISPWLHHTKLYVEHQPNSSTSFSPMQAVMPSQLRLGVLSSEFGTASILSPLPLRASLVIMVVSPPNTWFDHRVMQTSLVSIQRWVCWCTCSVGDWAHWKRQYVHFPWSRFEDDEIVYFSKFSNGAGYGFTYPLQAQNKVFEKFYWW